MDGVTFRVLEALLVFDEVAVQDFADDVLDVGAPVKPDVGAILSDLCPQLDAVAGLGQAPLAARVPGSHKTTFLQHDSSLHSPIWNF